MATQRDYQIKSEKERIALKELLPTFFDKYNWTYYLTPVDGYDIYDAYVMIFNEGGSIIKRIIIECKVRDAFYDKLMLESKKYNDLKNKAKNGEEIFYLSVTTAGSYLFNLSSINEGTDWKREMHWKSTTDKSLGKIEKKVTYLDVESAKKRDLSTDKVNYLWSENQRETSLLKGNINREMMNQKKKYCLFENVLK